MKLISDIRKKVVPDMANSISNEVYLMTFWMNVHDVLQIIDEILHEEFSNSE